MKFIHLIIVCSFFLINCTDHKESDLPILSFKLNNQGQKDFYKIDNFSFLNQDSIIITPSSTKGKVHTANFFFTSCPSICPKMREVHIEIANTYKNEADFIQLSFSIDPKRDSVQKLKNYIATTDIKTNQWQLLRGNDRDLEIMADLLKTNFKPNEDGTDFYHSSYVALIDKQQQIRGFYNLLNPKEVKLLKSSINELLKE